MKDKIVDSFNRIALLKDKWDHNRHYEKLLLSKLSSCLVNGLDIGCGTGEFTKKLSEKINHVLGIDISPMMIKEATKRHPNANIEYILKDFDELDESKKYDCIVSIATFHHLNLETALPKINRLLTNGGVLLVLDLYERKGLIDFLLNLTAVPANFILKRIKNGNLKDSPEEIQAWKEHGKIDTYMTYRQLKETYRSHFSYNFELKRLLFWRYILFYKKED